jgi:adenylate kinase family enzyme
MIFETSPIETPRFRPHALVLSLQIHSIFETLLENQNTANFFASLGLPTENSLTLVGGPGTGKTAIAHALAHRMGRKILNLDVKAVIEHGRNVPHEAELIADTPSVLVLIEVETAPDEFTIRRLTEFIDKLTPTTPYVLTRQYDWNKSLYPKTAACLELGNPGEADIHEYLTQRLASAPEVPIATIAHRLVGKNWATIAWVCEQLRGQHVPFDKKPESGADDEPLG